MVFSTFLNRQLYVATGKVDTTPSTLGHVQVKNDADGGRYLIQKGQGGLVRSDIIYPGSVMWATASGPKDTQIILKAKKLALKITVNGGNPIVGQDYIVRVNFRQLYGMSDEDIYQKFGAVHAKSTSTTAFYKEMAYSLFKNFNRVYAPLLYVGICDDNGFSLIKSASKSGDSINFTCYTQSEISSVASTDVTSPTGIIIAEQSQVNEWALGTKQYTPINFDVIPTTVINGAAGEVEWGTVSDFTSTYNLTVGNGYKFADLEYFCMGERADQYRNVNWPNAILTKYLVNPANTYYSLDIHYAYQGTCEDIQKSEKTMTIISSTKSVIESIISALGLENSPKIKATDLFDGTLDGTIAYPTNPIHDTTEMSSQPILGPL